MPPCQVESSDLMAYGLIPEFIGRFPILTTLLALNEDQMVKVTPPPVTCHLSPATCRARVGPRRPVLTQRCAGRRF